MITDLNTTNEVKKNSSVWTKKAMERAAANASVIFFVFYLIICFLVKKSYC